jgi:hypothetical protein
VVTVPGTNYREYESLSLALSHKELGLAFWKGTYAFWEEVMAVERTFPL